MNGYPDGCTQSTHDRAFDELGPSPAELAAEADADNDLADEDAFDYPEPEEMISKRDAATIARVFVRIEQQIACATLEGRHDDATAMCRIFGATAYHAFGWGSKELGA